ncbi:MAG: hypothetical protein D6797_06330, partial [Bdellovibrio sp.]
MTGFAGANIIINRGTLINGTTHSNPNIFTINPLGNLQINDSTVTDISGISLNTPNTFIFSNATINSTKDNSFGIQTINPPITSGYIINSKIFTSGDNSPAIEFQSVENVDVNSTLIKTFGLDSKGIHYFTGSTFVMRNMLFYNNTVITQNAQGIFIDEGDGISIVNNNITTKGNNNKYGIYIDNNGDQNLLLGNIINTTGTSSPGVYIHSGSDNTNITSNKIFTNGSSSYGVRISLTSINTVQSLNEITTDAPNTPGIYIESSSDNNNITFSRVLTKSTSSPALQIIDSTNNYINNSNFTTILGSTSYSFRVEGSTDSTFLVDTLLNAVEAPDVSAASTGKTTLLNVTFNVSELDQTAVSGGEVHVGWWVFGNVTNTSNMPVQNANITVYDKDLTELWTSWMTDAFGHTSKRNVTQFIQYPASRTNFTNHTFFTTHPDYIDNTHIEEINRSMYVNIRLYKEAYVGSTSAIDQGFGENVTITARVIDPDGPGDIDTVWVNITDPNNNFAVITMDGTINPDPEVWVLNNYTNYINGTYTYRVYANDSTGTVINSSDQYFRMYINLSTHIQTEKQYYKTGDFVNLTSGASYVQNDDLNTNSTAYILMGVEYNNSGTWIPFGQPVVNGSADGTKARLLQPPNNNYDLSIPFNNKWDVKPGYQNGTYRVYFNATNLNGSNYLNKDGTPVNSFSTFMIDQESPVLTWDKPANQSWFKNSVPVSIIVNVSDTYSGIENNSACVITIDNNPSGYVGSLTYYNDTRQCKGQISFSGLTDGTHKIRVNVTDRAGNTGESDNLTFYIDNTPPTITIISPSDNDVWHNATNITIFARLNDSSGVNFTLGKKCQVLIDGTNNSINYSNVNITNFIIGYVCYGIITIKEDSGFSNENHELTIKVNDSLNNTGTSNPINLTFDNTPPSITFEAPTPTNGARTIGNKIVVNVSLLDNLNLSFGFDNPCMLEWTNVTDGGTENKTMQKIPYTSTSPTGTCNLSVSTLDGKDYSFKVWARDYAKDQAYNQNWNVTQTITFRENDEPAMPTLVNITNKTPDIISLLTCDYTLDSPDNDGDSVSAFFTWTKNNVFQFNGTGLNTFDCSAQGCVAGDNVTCGVKGYDGYEYGPQDNDTVWIQNSPPVIFNPKITTPYQTATHNFVRLGDPINVSVDTYDINNGLLTLACYNESDNTSGNQVNLCTTQPKSSPIINFSCEFNSIWPDNDNHSIYCWVNDTAGANSSIAQFIVTADNKAPECVIQVNQFIPLPGYLPNWYDQFDQLGSSLNVFSYVNDTRGSSFESSGLKSIDWSWDHPSGTSYDQSGNDNSDLDGDFSITGLSDDPDSNGINLSLIVTDNIGNINNTCSELFNFDSAAPVSSDDYTNDGVWFSQPSVSVNIDCNDDSSVTGVGCYYTNHSENGGLWNQDFGPYPFTLVVSGDGQHNITYFSVDYLNNTEATQKEVKVWLDSTAPNDFTLSVFSANASDPPGWAKGTNEVNLTWEDNGDSPSGIDHYKIWWNCTPNDGKDLSALCEGPMRILNDSVTLLNYTTDPLPSNTTFYFKVEAVDMANNTKNSTNIGVISVDSDQPSVSIITPTGTNHNNLSILFEVLYSNTYTVNCNITHNATVTTYDMNNDGSVFGTANYTIPFPADGEYNVTAYCWDLAQNVKSDEMTISIDTDNPTVTLVEPKQIVYNYNESLPLNFSADPMDGSIDKCWYNLNNGNNITIPGCTVPASFSVPGEGQYNLTVFVNDTYGNIGNDSINFTVDFCDPSFMGDWNIGRNLTCRNRIINLSGNLTVTSTGNLTLSNVTLYINGSAPIDRKVEVQAGGELNIINGSELFGVQNFLLQNNYLFWALAGSNVKIADSTIHNIGYYTANPNTNGLFISTQNANLSNVTIMDGFGLVVNNLNNLNFSNINISTNGQHRHGIYFVNSNLIRIINSIITSINANLTYSQGSSAGQNELINTTMNSRAFGFDSSGNPPSLLVQWYFNANITDSGGNGINGITVLVNSTEPYSNQGVSDVNGVIPRLTVRELLIGHGIFMNYSNYTITAKKKGYNTYYNTTIMDQSRFFNIVMGSDLKMVEANASKNGSVGVGETVTFTAKWDKPSGFVKILVDNEPDFIGCNYTDTSGCFYCNSTPTLDTNASCDYITTTPGFYEWHLRICNDGGLCDHTVSVPSIPDGSNNTVGFNYTVSSYDQRNQGPPASLSYNSPIWCDISSCEDLTYLDLVYDNDSLAGYVDYSQSGNNIFTRSSLKFKFNIPVNISKADELKFYFNGYSKKEISSAEAHNLSFYIYNFSSLTWNRLPGSIMATTEQQLEIRLNTTNYDLSHFVNPADNTTTILAWDYTGSWKAGSSPLVLKNSPLVMKNSPIMRKIKEVFQDQGAGGGLYYCPFFDSWNGTNYITDTTFHYRLEGKEMEAYQLRDLKYLSLDGKIKARIVEREPEISYTDSISVFIIDTKGPKTRIHELKPVYASRGLSKILEADNNYLTMKQGDEVYLEFEEAPPVEEGYTRSVKLRSKGYYEWKGNNNNSKKELQIILLLLTFAFIILPVLIKLGFVSRQTALFYFAFLVLLSSFVIAADIGSYIESGYARLETEIPATGNFTVTSCDRPSGIDWQINEECTFYDSKIIMENGQNIIINNGGALNLYNSSLVMNLSADGGSNINVSGGNLTLYSGSKINSTSGANYFIQVHNGSVFVVNSSNITDAGHSQAGEEGVWVNTSNVIVYNTSFIMNYIGLILDAGSSNSNIADSNFINSAAAGLKLLANNTTLTNNVFSSGIVGVEVHSNNNYFENNTADSNTNLGINLSQAKNNILINLNIIGSPAKGVVFNANSYNNTFINSIISGPSTSIESNNAAGLNTFINSTFTTTNYIGGGGIDVRWFFNVNVTNTSGASLSGVNVTSFNNTLNQIFNENTVNGRITLKNLTEYIENASGRYPQTNYTFQFVSPPYVPKDVSWNLTESTVLNVTLYHNITVDSITATPDPQGFGENVTINATITDDDGIGDVQSVLINITNPTGQSLQAPMSYITGNTWQYIYTDYTNGTYNVTVTTFDTDNNRDNLSSSFNIHVNFSLAIDTDKEAYLGTDVVRLSSDSHLNNTDVTNASIFIKYSTSYYNQSNGLWEYEDANETWPLRIKTGENITLNDTPTTYVFDVLSSTHGDGTYAINLTLVDPQNNSIQDINGNIVSDQANFTIDTTKPAINLVYPANNTKIYINNVNFSWNVTDNLDTNLSCDLFVTDYSSQWSQANILSQNNTVTNYTINLPAGIYDWNVTCRDDAGNENTSATYNFTINSIPYFITTPYIDPASPRTNESFTCKFTINDSDAGDTLTATVEWWDNSTGSYSFNYQEVIGCAHEVECVSTPVPIDNATHYRNVGWRCEVTASDGTNTSLKQASPNIKIINTRPWFNETLITYSADSGTSWNITVNCSDWDVDDAAADVLTFDKNDTMIDITKISDHQANISDSPTDADTGTHNINLSCTDDELESGYATLIYTVNDATPPTWSNNRTNASIIRIGDSVKFEVDWADGNGLSNYSFAWNDSSLPPNNFNFTPLGATSATANYTATVTSPQGTVVGWNFTAWDIANNKNTTLTFSFVVADTAPIASIFAPDNETYTRTSIDLEYNVSDADGLADVASCSIYAEINGTGYNIIHTNHNPQSGNSFTYSVADPQIEDVRWYVNCTDTSGLSNVSETRTFYVDTVNPIPIWNIPKSDNSFVQPRWNTTLMLSAGARNDHLEYVRINITNSTGSLMYENETVGNISEKFGQAETFIFDANIDITSWDSGIYNTTIWANDSAGNFNEYSVTFLINHPPVLTSSKITPNPAYTNSNLVCSEDVWFDADNHQIQNRSFKWWKNYVALPFTTQQLGAGNFSKGDNITCELTIYDGASPTEIYDKSSPVNATVQIQNSVPTMDSVSASISLIYGGNQQTIGANIVDDIDMEPLTFSCCETPTGTCDPIADSVCSGVFTYPYTGVQCSYPTSLVTDNFLVYCVLNDTDDFSAVRQTSYDNDADDPIIKLLSPANDSRSSSSTVDFVCNVTDTYELGQVSFFINLSGATLEFNESKDATGDNNYTAIFTKTLPDGKYHWTCNATDLVGHSVFAAENNTIIVDTTAPTVTLSHPINNSNFTVDDIRFNWTVTDAQQGNFLCNLTIDDAVNQSSIPAANGAETWAIVSNLSNTTHNWSVSCSDESSYTATSETRWFRINNIPIIQSVNVTPQSPNTSTPLNCSFNITDLDLSDALAVNVTWYHNATGIFERTIIYDTTVNCNNGELCYTDKSVSASDTNHTKHVAWKCSITVFDGINITSANSTPTTIINTPPRAANVVLNSTDPRNLTNSTLNANWVFEDDDSDLQQDFTIKWYNNSVEYPPLENSTSVGPGNTTRGETWQFNISLSDGEEFGRFYSSNPILIRNFKPVINSVNITPQAPLTTNNLSCEFNITDIDLDLIGVNITWWDNATGSFVNVHDFDTTVQCNSNQICITDLPVDSGFADHKKRVSWKCSINATDGDNSTGYFNSTPVEILNTPPNNPLTQINSTSGLNSSSEDLNCFATISDNDTDMINVSVRWYNNSVLWMAVDYNNSYANGTFFNAVLGYGNTSPGQVWKCGMMLSDDEDNSNWVNSSTIVIGDNSLPNIIWESPTPNNGQIINQHNVYLNATIIDESNTSAFFDWNRSLLGYYSMDYYNTSGIKDNSTYSILAAFNGGLSTSNITTGIYGNAIAFDGSNDYLNMTQRLSGNVATYGGWLYFDTLSCPGSYCVPMQQANSADAGYEMYTDTSNKLRCYDGINTAPSGPAQAPTISTGTWYHAMCVHNGTHFALFLNGTLMGSWVASTASPTNEDFVVGGGVQQGSYWFKGKVDEVQIYNRALSPEEISAIYNNKQWRLKHNFVNLQKGTYYYAAFAIDSYGNLNKSEQSVTVNNTPPVVTSIFINSTDGSNTTSQDLHCYANISDFDNDTLNVTVRWEKFRGPDPLTDWDIMYEGTYSGYQNGDVFYHVLGSGNTSKGEQWICVVRLHDGTDFGNWLASYNMTILNTPPTLPTILDPLNETSINYEPYILNWTDSTDADLDNITYFVYHGNVTPPPFKGSTNESNWTVSNHNNFQKYYWYLNVSDGEVNVTTGIYWYNATLIDDQCNDTEEGVLKDSCDLCYTSGADWDPYDNNTIIGGFVPMGICVQNIPDVEGHACRNKTPDAYYSDCSLCYGGAECDANITDGYYNNTGPDYGICAGSINQCLVGPTCQYINASWRYVNNYSNSCDECTLHQKWVATPYDSDGGYPFTPNGICIGNKTDTVGEACFNILSLPSIEPDCSYCEMGSICDPDITDGYFNFSLFPDTQEYIGICVDAGAGLKDCFRGPTCNNTEDSSIMKNCNCTDIGNNSQIDPFDGNGGTWPFRPTGICLAGTNYSDVILVNDSVGSTGYYVGCNSSTVGWDCDANINDGYFNVGGKCANDNTCCSSDNVINGDCGCSAATNGMLCDTGFDGTWDGYCAFDTAQLDWTCHTTPPWSLWNSDGLAGEEVTGECNASYECLSGFDNTTNYAQNGTCLSDLTCDNLDHVAFNTSDYLANCSATSSLSGHACDSDATTGSHFSQDGLCLSDGSCSNQGYVVMDCDSGTSNDYTDSNTCDVGIDITTNICLNTTGDSCDTTLTDGAFGQTGMCAQNSSGGIECDTTGGIVFDTSKGAFMTECSLTANGLGGYMCDEVLDGDFVHNGYCDSTNNCVAGITRMDCGAGDTCDIGVDAVYSDCDSTSGDACDNNWNDGSSWAQTGTCAYNGTSTVCDDVGDIAFDSTTYYSSCAAVTGAQNGIMCENNAASGGDFNHNGYCRNEICDDDGQVVVDCDGTPLIFNDSNTCDLATDNMIDNCSTPG